MKGQPFTTIMRSQQHQIYSPPQSIITSSSANELVSEWLFKIGGFNGRHLYLFYVFPVIFQKFTNHTSGFESPSHSCCIACNVPIHMLQRANKRVVRDATCSQFLFVQADVRHFRIHKRAPWNHQVLSISISRTMRMVWVKAVAKSARSIMRIT